MKSEKNRHRGASSLHRVCIVATSRLHRGYIVAASRLHRGGTAVASKIHRGCIVFLVFTTAHCISAEILIKIVHLAHFQAYFLVFQTIFRTATMTLHFFSKKSQNSPKTFFWEPYDPMFFKKLYEKMNFNNTTAKKMYNYHT